MEEAPMNLVEDPPKKKQIVLLGQLITVNDPAKVVLPEHLVMGHILPRLPLKSLVRFKAVSKFWCSFISSSRFAERRLKLASSPSNFILVDFSDCPRRMFLLPYDDKESRDIPNLVDVTDYPRRMLEKKSYVRSIVASCNGLVCLLVKYFVDMERIALWNPLTTHYQLLPYPFRPFNVNRNRLSMDASGFGYLSSADDYKVLCMYTWQAEWGQYLEGQFYVFSLRSGEWTRLDHLKARKYALSLLKIDGFYIDDSLYWPNRDGSAPLGVLRFDLSDHQMTQLPQTSWLGDYDRVERMFDLRGDLSLCCSKGSREKSDVWVFQKKGTIKTWLILYSIDTTNLTAMAFSRCGMLLAHHLGRVKLLEISAWQNSDDLPKGFVYAGDVRTLYAWPYAESLVDCRIKKLHSEQHEEG